MAKATVELTPGQPGVRAGGGQGRSVGRASAGAVRVLPGRSGELPHIGDVRGIREVFKMVNGVEEEMDIHGQQWKQTYAYCEAMATLARARLDTMAARERLAVAAKKEVEAEAATEQAAAGYTAFLAQHPEVAL